MSETTPDPTMVTLARAMDRHGKRIGLLEENLRVVMGEVAGFAGATPAGPAFGQPAEGTPPVHSWLLAAGSDAESLPGDLVELIAWLDLVYLRFPDALLTACWLWHPSVVEELWWLRGAHCDAYDGETGSWLRVGDWHDRQRPGVARRVRDVLARCDLSLHTGARNDRGRVVDPGPAPMAEHAAALAVEWGRSGTRPPPTPEQLDEARALGATQMRSRR